MKLKLGQLIYQNYSKTKKIALIVECETDVCKAFVFNNSEYVYVRIYDSSYFNKLNYSK